MKTRAKKGTSSLKKPDEHPVSKIEQLEPSVSHPPKIFVLPKDSSEEARVVTLPNPVTSTRTRYFVCPQKGFYEFTRVAAPKAACRSWLLAPDHTSDLRTSQLGEPTPQSEAKQESYVLQTPEMLMATPIDPLFMTLPALTQVDQDTGGMQMFLSLSDYVDRLEEQSSHLRQMMRDDREAGGRLERILEGRVRTVCDELDTGEEKLYKLSNQKLLNVLLDKAQVIVARGLPSSVEERFVKQPLVVPVMSVKREESGMSLASAGDSEETANGASQEMLASTSTSQDTQCSITTTSSISTSATSVATTLNEDSSAPSVQIQKLLRLRTALNSLLASYIAPPLRQALNHLLATSAQAIDFKPLDLHLVHVEKLKQEAQTLRSLSENISRKRGIEDDDEAMERAEAKRKKKEEDEFRKKNMSRGVQQLKKADTSGMQKLSSFFGKPTAKK